MKVLLILALTALVAATLVDAAPNPKRHHRPGHRGRPGRPRTTEAPVEADTEATVDDATQASIDDTTDATVDEATTAATVDVDTTDATVDVDTTAATVDTSLQDSLAALVTGLDTSGLSSILTTDDDDTIDTDALLTALQSVDFSDLLAVKK